MFWFQFDIEERRDKRKKGVRENYIQIVFGFHHPGYIHHHVLQNCIMGDGLFRQQVKSVIV